MIDLINAFVILSTTIVGGAMLFFTIQNLRQNRRRNYDEFIEKRKQRNQKD